MQMKVHCRLVHVRLGGVATSVAGVLAMFAIRMVKSTGIVKYASAHHVPHATASTSSNQMDIVYVMHILQDSA